MSHTPLHWGVNEFESPNPFWGAWTSTINWCEQDYAITQYMAEFINTITNAWVIALLVSLFGVYKYNLPRRYWIIFVGISCVGVGSWMFHMTLRWEWQVLGDELPMIIAACCLFFMVLDITPVNAPDSLRMRNLLISGGLCFSIFLFVSITYIWTGIAAFHQVSFALIEFACGGRVFYLLKKVVKADDPDPRIRKQRTQIVNVFLMGAFFFLLGFILWNGDNLFCTHLTHIKKKVGLPFSFFFELHGWWHLLTGYGTILMSHAATLLVLIIREGTQNFEMKMWGGWFPIVKRIRDPAVGKGLLSEQTEDVE